MIGYSVFSCVKGARMSTLRTPASIARPTVSVRRERVVRASAEQIFALMREPSGLSAVLPRVSRIEILAQREGQATVRTHMSLAPLGNITSEGIVTWVNEREVVFRSERPVAIESRWMLISVAQGTRVVVELALDLAPMMGPLAAFVPPSSVSGMLIPDLDAALLAIAKRVEG